MKNRSGKFVDAGPEGHPRGRGEPTQKPDARTNALSIVNPPERKYPLAYPISTYTYVIVPTQSAKAADLKKFLFWAVTKGQKFGPKLLFEPIPKPVARRRREDDHEDPQLGENREPIVTSLDAHRRSPPPLHGAAGRVWATSLLQGVAGAAALGATRSRRPDRLEGHRGRAALRSRRSGSASSRHVAWDPVQPRASAPAASSSARPSRRSSRCCIAAPLAIGIALFLTELAPRFLRGPVTALVETLAAIPSVVIGLWGILVLGPVLRDHVEPALHTRARLHPALRAAVD